MTFRPLVKVCGIKLYEDAEMLMRYDPDMLGVVLDPSIPRAGDETLLRKMDGLGVERVGVYTSDEIFPEIPMSVSIRSVDSALPADTMPSFFSSSTNSDP